MERKAYIPKEFIILGELLKAPVHLREVSRRTGINHMTVKKVIDEFLEENILDFKEEGKNKVFYLKDNLEVKGMKLVYEVYKNIEVMRKYPSLRNIFEEIQRNKQIKLAILFGSYAKDKIRKESDIDIYLETQNVGLKKEIEKINSCISVKIGEFDRKNFLIKEIIENHIIIKGFEEYYEK